VILNGRAAWATAFAGETLWVCDSCHSTAKSGVPSIPLTIGTTEPNWAFIYAGRLDLGFWLQRSLPCGLARSAERAALVLVAGGYVQQNEPAHDRWQIAKEHKSSQRAIELRLRLRCYPPKLSGTK
jgi:hypothetical protein